MRETGIYIKKRRGVNCFDAPSLFSILRRLVFREVDLQPLYRPLHESSQRLSAQHSLRQ